VEEELARVRRTIAVTQPEPVPPWQGPSPQPADLPEPAQGRSGLSVAEQDAAQPGPDRAAVAGG
jgi:hypothetical protein